jgi:hypothetical protein
LSGGLAYSTAVESLDATRPLSQTTAPGEQFFAGVRDLHLVRDLAGCQEN